MTIQLSEHFNYKKLLRFVFPSIIMMIFTSIYGVVDGLFVSNYAGKTAFAAVNLIMPFLMILGALGFMFGTGGSAIVAKTMGEGDAERANRYFSMIVLVTIISGVIITAAGIVLLRPISIMLGAQGQMVEYCVMYGRIIMLAQTAFMLQNVFQSFFVTAEKPHLGLAVTVAAGVTNMILDWLLVAVIPCGIAGAAVATALSQLVGGVLPLIYFLRKNSSTLRLTKTSVEWKVLLKSCINGSSELMTNLSLSLVNMLYNWQLIKMAGEDGIAAYGVIMYVNFVFISVFIGYSIGSAPVISYHYGADNHSELKSLFRKSLFLVGIWSVMMVVSGIVLSAPLSKVFVGYDAALFEMTKHGFKLYALSFLVCGFNIFGSAFFTALNNGVISAAISFLRTFAFQTVTVIVLPLLFGLDGIWLAMTFAELLALGVTGIFFIANGKRYYYM